MPQMGVSVSEGTILEWRKRPGDWIEADETICDVTTDKVDVEIPAPASGRLEQIVVEPGDTVEVGDADRELDGGARRPGRRIRQRAPAQPKTGPLGSTRPSCGAWPPSTRSTWAGRRARASAGGSARRTSWPTWRATHRERQHSAALHTESPYRPSRRAGGGARRSRLGHPRAAVADAPADRRAHGRDPAHVGALHDDRRGRLRRGSRPGAPSSRGDGAPRRQASPTSPSSRRRRSRRWRSSRSSTRRSRARSSSITTTSTSGSPWRSTTG